jgi:hypothetical protein
MTPQRADDPNQAKLNALWHYEQLFTGSRPSMLSRHGSATTSPSF